MYAVVTGLSKEQIDIAVTRSEQEAALRPQYVKPHLETTHQCCSPGRRSFLTEYSLFHIQIQIRFAATNPIMDMYTTFYLMCSCKKVTNSDFNILYITPVHNGHVHGLNYDNPWLYIYRWYICKFRSHFMTSAGAYFPRVMVSRSIWQRLRNVEQLQKTCIKTIVTNNWQLCITISRPRWHHFQFLSHPKENSRFLAITTYISYFPKMSTWINFRFFNEQN